MSRLELALQNDVLLELSGPDCRLFRNANTHAWVGTLKGHGRDGSVILHPGARHISAGLCDGSGDVIGITRVWIPEPRWVGLFTSIELKAGKSKPQANQRNFAAMVRELGGLAGFARTVDEARAIVEGR